MNKIAKKDYNKTSFTLDIYAVDLLSYQAIYSN